MKNGYFCIPKDFSHFATHNRQLAKWTQKDGLKIGGFSKAPLWGFLDTIPVLQVLLKL
jgi:hypothetical protein